MLTCEDGICGFCKVCNASMVHAKLPSVMIEAERQRQADANAMQAEMHALKTALRDANDELAQLRVRQSEPSVPAALLGVPSSLRLLGPPPSRIEDVLA